MCRVRIQHCQSMPSVRILRFSISVVLSRDLGVGAMDRPEPYRIRAGACLPWRAGELLPWGSRVLPQTGNGVTQPYTGPQRPVNRALGSDMGHLAFMSCLLHQSSVSDPNCTRTRSLGTYRTVPLPGTPPANELRERLCTVHEAPPVIFR